MILRPSKHEILSKVDKALEAIACGNRQVARSVHLADNFEDCSIYDENDLWEKLPKLSMELKGANPVLCYAGTNPPMRADDPFLEGLELWAYHWYSDMMNFRIYLKFCIKYGADKKPHYLHASIHQDRQNI
jgi:hypothetical protein